MYSLFKSDVLRMNGQPLILVVEQNLHHLKQLNSHLKSLNCACICTKQGIRSLILAQTHQPELILLDMLISDISGGQVIDYLQREPKTANIPIIAVIPWYLAQKCERLFLINTNDYITKPYNFSKLEDVLAHHLNHLSFSSLLSG